jgi:hypothetical protein|tara:strand:- start:121 stop:315 length:195 start_codon:yes stop_codon:yes gene_type:complete
MDLGGGSVYCENPDGRELLLGGDANKLAGLPETTAEYNLLSTPSRAVIGALCHVTSLGQHIPVR